VPHIIRGAGEWNCLQSKERERERERQGERDKGRRKRKLIRGIFVKGRKKEMVKT
jgi:hypothetical protein